MAGRDDKSPAGRVFFEFTQLGQQMRVAAIDEATGTEVVVITPLTATRFQMQSLALAKLRRKLGADEPPPPPGPKPAKYA
ncbi:MAG TPA: serine hydroxymethyltransferase [Devosia sp.]|jgi:hypothetical protein|uniref:DUF6898 family protein n=1 Tax=Devosia sp. TaxID=1871048 RepID=UPI002DDCB5E8|nr:serine hydroxymethyltransferase [Devosia sp.]HEV2516843.1 serine hydroxymethyltransferase [Devosia sp.]